MQDPFRPNSNAQLMREAQIGFIVVGLLLCVLVYVAFYRLTNRSSRFDEIARNVAVAEPIDSDPYQARSVVQIEQRLEKRLADDKKGPFAAIEEFASVIKNSASGQTSPDEKVTQATHMASDSPSNDGVGSTVKTAATTLPSPNTATATGFAPVSKQIPNKYIPKAPRPFESPLGRSNRSDFDAAKELNPSVLPKKQTKVAPPVLTSKFGGVPSQDFLPVPISKKVEIQTDSTDFEASPPLPSKVETNPAPQFPTKPKSRAPDSISRVLTDQLPPPAIKEESSNFVSQRSTSKEQLESKKIDFGRPDESSLIAQTSAFEPVNAAPVLLPQPSEQYAKASTKEGETYSTKQGDSLWTIAQAVYGDGRYFRALYEMNRDTLSLSDSIPKGTLLKVSSIEELQREYPRLCPKKEKDNQARDESDAADANQTRDDELDQRFYRTEDGDTLFEIARQRLGQASRYLEIYELNRFRIPETANHLTPLGGGIELLLPQ